MNAFTTSTAVMARRVEPADSLDFFPTAPWATRAFMQHVLPRFEPPRLSDGQFAVNAIDPACGEGHMALALRERMAMVTATDVFAYGFGGVADFLHPDQTYAPRDWIITNPPFNVGVDFVLRALSIARRGVAMLVRAQFLEGEERQDRLFGPTPPAAIAQFVERVPMHKGRWVVNGTTATAYCWLVWHTNQPAGDPAYCWIPKSRKLLSRPDDWLRFHGCWDLPATHKAMKLLEASGRRHAVTIEAARYNAGLARPRPASIGDVRQRMEALL